MAQKQTSEYGAYDRILDWFSDHRQLIAKTFVLVAIAGMMATLVLSAIFT